MNKFMLKFGVFNGFLFVLFSAFGAHALKELLSPTQKGWFELASDYQIIHALALIACGLWAQNSTETKRISLVGWFFILGIMLFSGSLYAMALGAPKWLEVFTPLGGTCLLAGWLIWFFVLIRK